jgi:hypothetical protein
MSGVSLSLNRLKHPYGQCVVTTTCACAALGMLRNASAFGNGAGKELGRFSPRCSEYSSPGGS